MVILSILNLRLCSFNGYFQWMFFTLIKEINKLRKEVNRLKKEINRLFSKGIPNIYLKVTIEKNWRYQIFDFLSLENLSLGQFWGCST